MKFLTLPVLYGLIAALAAALLFAGVQSYRLNSERTAHATTLKEHAEATANAYAEAREKADRDALAGDVVADETRAGAAQDARAAREGTTQTIETIRYAYRTQIVPADCPPATAPERVQDALRSAYEAAAAAQG